MPAFMILLSYIQLGCPSRRAALFALESEQREKQHAVSFLCAILPLSRYF